MTPIEEVLNLLAAAASDTQYRTVASRAYFAAFNQIIRLAQQQGFVPRSSGDDHRDLIAFLKRSRSSFLNRIGHSRLPRLRAIRNRADYDQGQPFPRGLAEEAVKTAEEMIAWISNLSP
jgi:uncharacterized protein (UPF0332 family)